MSSVPRPAWPDEALRVVRVTHELISVITLPASFTARTVSVNGSPARAVDWATTASRCTPLEIARTCVVLPVRDGFVTSVTVICCQPPVERRTSIPACPFAIATSGPIWASGSFEVRRTTSVTPPTGFHHWSQARMVHVKA